MGFFYCFEGGVDVLTSLTVTEAQYNNNQVELTLSDGRKVCETENKCVCRLRICIKWPRSCSQSVFLKSPKVIKSFILLRICLSPCISIQ